MRMVRKLMILAFVVAACGGTSDGVALLDDLPTTTADEFETHLAGIEGPAVVNVWASWCLPCRSEAPLLDEAAAAYGDRIEFIGVDVQDNQPDAKAFLAEFGLGDFDQFFDETRSVPNNYGGLGTPITLFFGPHGELIRAHNGVVDERTLALNIDELLRLDP